MFLKQVCQHEDQKRTALSHGLSLHKVKKVSSETCITGSRRQRLRNPHGGLKDSRSVHADGDASLDCHH